MDNQINRFSAMILRYRWPVLVLFSIITIMLAYGATKLKINNDHATWLPKHDEVAKLLLQVDEEFSSNVMVFTVIDFSDKGVFHPDSLALVERITAELEGMEELFNVTSITNIIDIRKTDDGIEVGELMSGIPMTPEGLEEFKNYVLSKEMYVNSIVSADCTYSALMTNIESSYDEVAIAQKIFDKVDEIAGDRPHYFGGDPAVHYYMNEYMNRDMQLLVPVMLVVMLFVLAFGLRRVTGVVFPLTLVGLSIVWTFGLMSMFLLPINILSPAVAVLLIAIGSDYAVHIYNHYLKRGDVLKSTSEIAVPVVMSALTTIAGLLAFATTKIEVLQNFGIELAFGLGSACVLSIILLAIGLYILRVKASPSSTDSTDDDHVFSRIMVHTASFVHGHARAILAVAAVGLVIMGYGITKIRTNVDFIGQLPKNSPPRQGCNILMDYFNGMYPFNLYVRGDIEHPAVMNSMNYLENYMRSEEIVKGYTSVNSLIAEENWLLNGVYAVPETRQGIANLWFMLEGQEILKTFVTTGRDKALVNSVVKESATGKMRYLAGRLESFMENNVSNEIVSIDPGKLTQQGRLALDAARLERASSQLSWLSGFYDRPNTVDRAVFMDRLSQGVSTLSQHLDFDPVWGEARRYLEEETVEVLPGALIEEIMASVRESRDMTDVQHNRPLLEQMIVQTGAMESEDARVTADGLIKRIDSSLRLQKAAALKAAFSDLFSPVLATDKDFAKRSDGVLWEYLSEKPTFFYRQVSSIDGIEKAVAEAMTVEIDQAGMPETIRVVHRLLISSQLQSLVLASIIVLILVSLTQRSFRRGTISLLSVLVPLEFILGFMGLNDIPLDLGTVLCGALIIGLGIDGSIHFLHYYHQVQKQGNEGERALQLTMSHVGRAVITANATTFCGFVVLLFSQTTAVKNFSLVNALAILLVTISIVTFLPALITVFHLGREREKDLAEADMSHVAKKVLEMEPAYVESVIMKRKNVRVGGKAVSSRTKDFAGKEIAQ
ncbi:MAG: MMPL family transporter [Deltaproteobacteria bacterium]|nr:MMPL family transporter [Deltaproteobacteria bacterium]